MGIWWENLRERDHLEGPGIDGRWENNINILLQGRGQEDLDLTHVAQDTDKWQDFVNRAIYFCEQSNILL